MEFNITNFSNSNSLVETLEEMVKEMGEKEFLKFAEMYVSTFIKNKKIKTIKEEEERKRREEEWQKKQKLEQEIKKLEEQRRIENSIRIEEPERIYGYKIVHTIPNMTEEEREQKKKEILRRLYNYFSEEKIKI